MTSFADLVQQGSTNLWLFIPSALLLGALHGLEPGHSKTMMAAFIIAVRGTVGQAILLGLCAALSHTAIVWAIALGGQYLGSGINTETTEPYLLLGSAVIVLGIGVWMIWRTRADQKAEAAHDHHHHHHGADEVRTIDTGHGTMRLEIFEDGVPPRWRASFAKGGWKAEDVTVTTDRGPGRTQTFRFVDRGDFIESVEEIPEPHEFAARVSLGHGGHSHDYDLDFAEHDRGHDHDAPESGLKVTGDAAYMDAHERAHAADISKRFADRKVTTGQIALFGLTGGLIPCPAAVTVLLLCLQLKRLTLGVVLVSAFSVGLAVTMVSAGVIASLSVNQIQKRWSGFGDFARKAPYASAGLMLVIACYMAYSGISGLDRISAL
ncbi:nickel/cobalt efflux transporter RcnA [Sphingomonas sp. MA1305]|mgnify:CR=1 FL=1|jgi:nickel/cobalt exporter|uniref:nickel/cobalt efflux transporter n=1 Tax=Sphingomonas sp. MA1305 TaxID=2479204 RepID=UPI0018DFBBAE|nr:nickel/cobalt efflux transporter [Sphingomonas sp. MA1305]MBI0477108.1 nickel/cobalt efflux transporter RcnA [Sphingomonas sp. MA1305]